MGKLIMGYWDCNYCMGKGILGSVRKCPSCGKSRDINTTFYMKTEKEYIDEETAKTINRNPDWICSYCSSLNSDSFTSCKSCGALKSKSEFNYLQNKSRNI